MQRDRKAMNDVVDSKVGEAMGKTVETDSADDVEMSAADGATASERASGMEMGIAGKSKVGDAAQMGSRAEIVM
jgi:hypothetical protein